MNFDLVDIEIHLEDSLIEEQALIKRGMKLSTPAEQTQNLNALLGRSTTNTVHRFIDHDIKAAGFFISMLFMIISLVQAPFIVPWLCPARRRFQIETVPGQNDCIG